jgi:hypothetical protein
MRVKIRKIVSRISQSLLATIGLWLDFSQQDHQAPNQCSTSYQVTESSKPHLKREVCTHITVHDDESFRISGPDLVPEVVNSTRCPQRCVLLNGKNDEAKKLEKEALATSSHYPRNELVGSGTGQGIERKARNAPAHPFQVRANLISELIYYFQ